MWVSVIVALAVLPIRVMAANTLDNLGLGAGTPAAAAYSMRKLSSSYNGYIITVRRTSDNTTQNIGFTAGGDLNQAALLSFVGTGSGYVTKWYDQSGSGNDVTQATAVNQPRIVNAGSIEVINTRPALYFGGVYFNLTAPVPVTSYPLSISVLANTSGSSTNGAFVKHGDIANGNAGIGIGIGNSNGSFDNAGTSVIGLKEWATWSPSNPDVSYPSSAFSVVAIQQNAAGGNSLTAYVNGTNVPLNNPNAAPNGTSITGNLYVGGYTNTIDRYPIFRQSEVIIFGSALSNADRQTIECNQFSYYSIVVPASVAIAQTICGSLTSNNLGGNTPSLGSGAWSKLSGPGATIFSAPASGSSTATASVGGAYVYRWTTTYGVCVSSADITVSFIGTGTRPTAVISGSVSICPGVSTTISVALAGTQPWNLTYSNGTNSTNVTGIASTPYIFSVSLTSTKTYMVTALTDANCTAQPGDLTGSAVITISNATLGTPLSAAAGYSVRKLNNCYTGYAMNIRRSSDNATQNIGFNAGGDLDQTALLAFVGAGSGYVTKWYDQSGSGNNVAQPAAANQPRIVNAGVVETINNRPALYFGGSSQDLFVSVPINTYPLSVSILANTSGGSTNGAFIKVGQDFTPNCGVGFGIGNADFDHSGTSIIGLKENISWCPSNPSLNYPSSAFTMVAIQQNAAGGNGLTVYVNSTNAPLSNATNGTNGTTISGNLYVGGYLANGSDYRFPVFRQSEVIIFGSAISPSDQATIETSQKNYYGINQVPPIASNVLFTGTLDIGSLQTGLYAYSDGNNDAQGTSTFKWYRSNDALGTGKTQIGGATSITYTLAAADDQKYISFEVTPVALTGASPGAPVESLLRGPVGQLHSDWSQTALGAIRGGAIGEAALFLGAGSTRQLLSRQLANGNSNWSYATPNGDCGPPTYYYVNPAYKLVAATGAYVVGVQDNGGSSSELFSPQNLGFAAGNPYISTDGNSFFVIYSDTMSCRSLSTGAATWKVRLPNASISADIVVFSDYIYAATADGVVKGDVVDFTPLSQYTITGSPGINLPLIIMNDSLYVTPNNNGVYAISAANMTTLYWKATLTATNSAPAWVVPNSNNVYAVAGTTIQKVQGGGSPVWTYNALATITAGPVAMNGVIYFGTSNGNYFAVRDNGPTCSIVTKWPVSIATGNCMNVWVDQTLNRVIFSTDGGNLDAFPLQ
jgi:hypothetical protein